MIYDENYLTKPQEKKVNKLLKDVKKFYKLQEPPPCTIMGLNPTEKLIELRASREGVVGKELDKINKEIKWYQGHADMFMRVTFEFDDFIKIMVVHSDWQPSSFLGASFYTWTCLLDFPISDPFIFGRVSTKVKHGFGEYRFAPFDPSFIAEFLETTNQKFEEKKEEGTLQKFLLNFCTAYPVLEILERLRRGQEFFDEMKTMLQLIKAKQQTGIDLIDRFNQNKDLMKSMKKVSHAGATKQGISRFVTEVDVSAVVIPFEMVTLLHLADYNISTHKHSLKAIYALTDALKEYVGM